MFSLFNFSSIFPGGSADPICPYVRTPMDVLCTSGMHACASSWLAAGDASPSDRLMPHVVIMAKLSELSSARTEQSRDSRAIPN